VAKRGYGNVMVFQDGIPGWVGAGYPLKTEDALPKSEIPSLTPSELHNMLGKVTVLDVRIPSLYEMGWIKNSVRIPLGDLSQRFPEIPRGNTVVVTDHLGKRVIITARFLISKGYEDVKRLKGGIMAWLKRGYPLVKDE
jgi:rhodanese-related sulfurtransferase